MADVNKLFEAFLKTRGFTAIVIKENGKFDAVYNGKKYTDIEINNDPGEISAKIKGFLK